MRIRNGHITNSSSSSFVVYNKLLTEEQREILCSDSKEIEDCDYYSTWIPFQYNEKRDIWTTECVCNQDEIYETLERNHIPYTAWIHYQHEVYIYDGKYRLEAPNYGEILNTYGIKHALMWKKVIERIDKKDKLTAEVTITIPEENKEVALSEIDEKTVKELTENNKKLDKKVSCWHQINEIYFEKNDSR